jgi:hypothetical protein
MLFPLKTIFFYRLISQRGDAMGPENKFSPATFY